MTTLTDYCPESEDIAAPVPWRRMAWVTWRQHRGTLSGIAVLLGAVAVGIWLAGLQLHHAYAAAVAACPGSLACSNTAIAFDNTNGFLSNGIVLQVIPALIGAFTGAPLLARELETGTFRFAWTQGIGRRRWAVAKVVLLGVAVTLAAWAVSELLTWYYQPYFAAGNERLGLDEITPFLTGVFSLHGVAFAAWTLAAFAIGALAGMLIRRIVPAIAATMAVYAALAFATGGFLRQHYLAPLVRSSATIPQSAWILGQWWTRGGRVVFTGNPPLSLLNQYCSAPGQGPKAGPGRPAGPSFAQCLAPHGYTQWTSYQPAGRFWTFQWIESGWLLALAVILIAATIWLVRRRAA